MADMSKPQVPPEVERRLEEAIASTWLWMDGRKKPSTMRNLATLVIGDLRAQGVQLSMTQQPATGEVQAGGSPP